MKISAIVPVWNGEELLRRLLDSVRAQTLQPAEVLVVDNGSTDGAPEVARRAGAHVIPMGRNAGFAAAVNRGIREARGEAVAVLNSDVELSPDYLSLLAAKLSETGAWFATGKILAAGSDTQIDGTFDVVCRGGTACRIGSGQTDNAWFSRPRTIWSAPWTAALFRAALFARTGLLAESFESYLEDVDFGLRCARQNLSGNYVPEARAWHRGSATLGRWHRETVRRIARNQIFLLARHYPKDLLRRRAWAILVDQLLWGCMAVRHGGGWAWLRGKWQGLSGFREARTAELFDAAQLDRLLYENEQIIRESQATAGRWDSYWRLHFLLCGEAK